MSTNFLPTPANDTEARAYLEKAEALHNRGVPSHERALLRAIRRFIDNHGPFADDGIVVDGEYIASRLVEATPAPVTVRYPDLVGALVETAAQVERVVVSEEGFLRDIAADARRKARTLLTVDLRIAGYKHPEGIAEAILNAPSGIDWAVGVLNASGDLELLQRLPQPR